jgi:hypothetical protein
MRRVFYPSGSVLTGDSIAQAVLEFAEALSKDGRADIIEIPVVLSSGGTGTATLLVSPSSQFASVTEESELTGPVDDVLVADLRNRAQKVATHRATAQPQFVDYFAGHDDYE